VRRRFDLGTAARSVGLGFAARLVVVARRRAPLALGDTLLPCGDCVTAGRQLCLRAQELPLGLPQLDEPSLHVDSLLRRRLPRKAVLADPLGARDLPGRSQGGFQFALPLSDRVDPLRQLALHRLQLERRTLSRATEQVAFGFDGRRRTAAAEELGHAAMIGERPAGRALGAEQRGVAES